MKREHPPARGAGFSRLEVWLEPGIRVPNSSLPVLIYSEVLPEAQPDPARFFEQLFLRHGWPDAWRDGIYPFHHYHSTAHEVLGVASGQAKLRLGGEEKGRNFDVKAGQVLVLPAGTGHKRLFASADFLVVGAYPEGCDCDLIRADEVEISGIEAARRRIARVPLPRRDPVSGNAMDAWTGAARS